jgi:hypothetical protein
MIRVDNAYETEGRMVPDLGYCQITFGLKFPSREIAAVKHQIT